MGLPLRVGVAMFGCLTVPKYRQQIEDAYATWVNDALAAGWIVRFYTERIPDDLEAGLKELCVNLNVGDGYISATWKQWRGLQHMREECETCDLYFTAGTDTFLNVKNMMRFLLQMDCSKDLYIGGGKGCEKILDTSYEYFSGGGGITLTGSLLDQMLAYIPEFIPWWISNVGAETGLIGACDLQVGLLLKNYIPSAEWVQNLDFHGDGPHTAETINMWDACTIHLMKHDDFYEYDKIIHASDADV